MTSSRTLCSKIPYTLLQIAERQKVTITDINAQVFFDLVHELRDRSFENQKHRASGLNLLVAAIVLWNTVYLERAANSLVAHGSAVDEDLLQHLSPLGWDHIALTGDYTWRAHRSAQRGQFRALRPLTSA